MLLTLILNEIKRNLLSQRLVIGLLFVLIVYSGGSIIFSKKFLDEKQKDSQNAEQMQQNVVDAEKSIEQLYQQAFLLVKTQELSSFFATGNESRLPKAMVVVAAAPQGASMFGGMMVGAGGSNYKLEKYTDFDLAFIVGIVLGFLAIVLSFDAISQDREEGTLKQQLSNGVPRIHILLAKFVAMMTLLLMAVVIGSITSMIIMQVLIGQSVVLSFPIEAILGVVLATVYLSMFVWLGLWVSASVRKSSTSLALLLLSWIGLAILSPYVGGMLAQRLTRVASQEEQNNNFQELIQVERFPPVETDFMHGRGRDEDWKIVESFYERQNDRFEKFIVHRFNELTNQAEMAESFSFYSPYGSFRQAMERLANTGLAYHRKFFEAARRYRQEVLEFVVQQDKLDPQSKHHIAPFPQVRSMSNKPVDPAMIPRFMAPSRHVSASDVVSTMPAVGYLLVLNVVCFGLALVRFARMDVR